MKISDHFGYNEFIQPEKSGEAVPCDLVKARFLSMLILEPARAALGGRPIHINSGKRSPEYNGKKDGAPKSEHLWTGESAAVDIDTRNPLRNKELFLWLYTNRHKSLGQLIAYFDEKHDIRFIHLSIVSDRHLQMQALTATYEKVGGKRIYQPYDNGGKPRRPIT